MRQVPTQNVASLLMFVNTVVPLSKEVAVQEGLSKSVAFHQELYFVLVAVIFGLVVRQMPRSAWAGPWCMKLLSRDFDVR